MPPHRPLDQADRKLRHTFFRSVTLLVSVAAIILCGSEGRFFPSGLTPLFAIAGWLLVDRSGFLRAPVWIGNIAAVAAFVAVSIEFARGNLEGKLLAGSHLIVYLTWIILLMPKSHRQYWWLVALTLLHLAVSGVLSTGAGFGAALVGMLLMMLWTLSVFSLFRVQDRHSQSQGAKTALARAVPAVAIVRNGLQRDPSDPWLGWRFNGMVMLSSLVSLVLAAFVFAAFPRVWVQGGSIFGSARAAQERVNRVTGATDSIELGRIGRLMLNSERVLSFEITDVRSGRPVSVEAFEDAMEMDEVRFRGNALGVYLRGRWTRGYPERGFPNNDQDTFNFGTAVGFDPAFRVDISQDPPFQGMALAPYPVTSATSAGKYRVHQRPHSGTLIWFPTPDGVHTTPLSFSVECPRMDGDSQATFEYWAVAPDVAAEDRKQMLQGNLNFARRRFIIPNLERELPQLTALARRICANGDQPLDEEERVARVLRHLSPDNGFKYSLQQTRSDRSLDPVEDFLLNTRTGHCEYFASACALMLQAVNIPTRLVTGYSGCEINAVSRRYEVRQSHAHAWVEAYINHRWETVEPTPASDRQSGILETQPGSLMTDFQLALTDLWNEGVHQMSAERQQAFFAPVIDGARELMQTIRTQGLLVSGREALRQFVTSPEVWFSWQGGVATFVLLLGIGLVLRTGALAHLLMWLRRVFSRLSRETDPSQSAIRFYARFLELCDAHGLPLSSRGTALENCDAARRYFAEDWNSGELQELPAQIAVAFNAVRFGHVALSDDAATRLGMALQRLTDALVRKPVSKQA